MQTNINSQLITLLSTEINYINGVVSLEVLRGVINDTYRTLCTYPATDGMYTVNRELAKRYGVVL